MAVQYGLLIDYEYCTNCGSCQVSCKEEHGYPVGKTGIQVHVDGPWKIDEENWNFNNWPLVTDLCDLCQERVDAGKLPACVRGGYDFVDVRDVADGCIAAADKGRRGECYILSNRYFSVRGLLGMLQEETKRKPIRTVLPLTAITANRLIEGIDQQDIDTFVEVLTALKQNAETISGN